MHGNDVKPVDGQRLTVAELAERIDRSERRVWQLLAEDVFGPAEHRQITDGLGRVHLQRVVPAERVDAYLAGREPGSTGGAGSGPSNPRPSNPRPQR